MSLINLKKTRSKLAKLGFVKRCVFRWEYKNLQGSSSIEFIKNGENSISFKCHDDGYQRCLKMRELGFVKGFWYAYSLKKNKKGYLFWDKKLKELPE